MRKISHQMYPGAEWRYHEVTDSQVDYEEVGWVSQQMYPGAEWRYHEVTDGQVDYEEVGGGTHVPFTPDDQHDGQVAHQWRHD